MILLPDLLYHDGGFRAGLALEYDEAAGRILRVLPATDADGAVRLRGRALMPGFINAHSHSFQRLIRGRTQWRPAGPEVSDFWSWRMSMYDAVLKLSPDALYDVARFCFMEMLCAGYTTVGEFHYVQRDPAGNAYDDPNEIATRIIAAAESVGIRISLLNVCYATGAIAEPLRPEQRRFNTPDLDNFMTATENLRTATTSQPLVSVGMAPHSLRAVPREWLRPLHDWARTHDAPYHMHVAEQPAEVGASREHYGMSPVEVLATEGVLDDRLTAVHATHLSDEDVRLMGDARAGVCLCPTTERDLGDGLARISDLVQSGATLCVGTDSQSVIDPLEELRLIEYNERLRLLRRVVLASDDAERRETTPLLIAAGTEGGARALRVNAGRFESGMNADFVAIDLDHPSLAGWTLDSLAALATLSAPASIVRDTWVHGRQRTDGGRHEHEEEITAAYRRVAEQYR